MRACSVEECGRQYMARGLPETLRQLAAYVESHREVLTS